MDRGLVRGAVAGGLAGLPLGYLSGSHLAGVLSLAPGSGGRLAFLGLVMLGWVAWAVFIGAMFGAESGTPRGR